MANSPYQIDHPPIMFPTAPLLAALAAAAATPLAHAANATFFPTLNMTDTSGNLIQAHGGDIIRSSASGSNDTAWYWFGEDKTNETTSGHFQAVNCYKSPDFSSWEFVGPVLSPVSGTNISSDSVVERPKVLYNDLNDEYVMWFHSDSANYGAARVGVATSKTIDGTYSYRGSFKPFGNDSRDMTIYKDPDTQTAYLIYATTNNADFAIASLDSDYYNVNESLYTFSSVYYEAPGVFKINGLFYLLYSPQDGWTPTEDGYFTSSSMAGPWSASTLLAEKGSYAYLTQNAYDITINGTEETLYLYYGDHWSGNELGSSTYSFYPVVYDSQDKSISLHQTGGWTLDAETGIWSDLPFTTITAADSTTPNTTLISCADGCVGVEAANMTSSQTFSFTYSGSAGTKVLGLLYTYNGPKNSFLHVRVTVDGVVASGEALVETSRGTTVQQETGTIATLKDGSEVVLTLLDSNGDEFLIDGVKIYEDPSCG
ncbi:hypothetical protein LTR78_008806 [Recurvomyces mirabilis]|uniref:Uncharacterized protein n=2 Tax=Recurvomyces mirabilis TaxID=574656 RepID=A0AAE0TPK6_9PEZI|nr:hypothetical protein LTR78_008806 [Recurvomyces mirabilis]